MYTAILERTREIGILKSLGATNGFIVTVLLREVAVLCVFGIAAGIGAGYAIRAGLQVGFPLVSVLITTDWILISALLAVMGACAGGALPSHPCCPAGSDPRLDLRLEGPMSQEKMIEIRSLKKVYRMGGVEVPALRGVDLDALRGEILAILGPSGSGKSTLFHVIGGLTPPTEGTVKVGGPGSRRDDESRAY